MTGAELVAAPEGGGAAENEARIAAFLDALTALAREHSITIGGCGCCGSPWLEVEAGEMPPGRYTMKGDHLEWEEGA